MIKITKPAQSPAVLRTNGQRKCEAHCQEFTDYANEFRQGTRTFAFDAGVYGHKTVKQALIEAQHGKCCFCERKIGADGDVEHFRPKAAVRQADDAPLLRPGYYWLAYAWDNLLLACPSCNQRHKKNLFPLTDPTARAQSHQDSVEAETPLFINPANTDPEPCLSFRDEIAYAVRGNRFAKSTILALGLNRPILKEVRRERLELLFDLQRILDLRAQLSASQDGLEVLRRAESLLSNAVRDEAEFAGMARAAAKRDFHPL